MIANTYFTRLLVSEQISELIPYLQTLTEKEKLTFSPYLQSLNEAYLVRDERGYVRATETQAKMLGLASLVCLDRSEFEAIRIHPWVLSPAALDRVLPWYCPGWFSDFVNRYAESHYLPICFDYDFLLRMMQKGWVRPWEETVVQFLPQLIYELRDHQWVYCPENLTRNAITLDEHLWYLFRYETNLNWSDQHLYYGERAAIETDWKYTLKLLAAGGKIDRQRLLKETTAAIDRPFNPSLHRWFVNLLDYLTPSAEELLAASAQPVIPVARPRLRSVGEVCQELFMAVEETTERDEAVAHRRSHPLPTKIPAPRRPQPYPREKSTRVP